MSRRAVVAAISAVAVLGSLVGLRIASAEPAKPSASRLAVGTTYTHYTLMGRNEAGGKRGEATLRSLGAGRLQNVHIVGFGVDDRRVDWAGLDARMAQIKRTGGTPVITLCCAPASMRRAGHPGQPPLEIAPAPDKFDAFAALSAKVAKRYPDVKYFLVWNELKGFWNEAKNRWDYEGYTKMYNKVYNAVRAVRRDARIGGPYAPMNHLRAGSQARAELKGSWGEADQRVLAAIKYWLKHKDGADFIVVDGAARQEENAVWPGNAKAAAKFADVTKWLRAQAPPACRCGGRSCTSTTANRTPSRLWANASVPC